jgi:hypothetical protein
MKHESTPRYTIDKYPDYPTAKNTENISVFPLLKIGKYHSYPCLKAPRKCPSYPAVTEYLQ